MGGGGYGGIPHAAALRKFSSDIFKPILIPEIRPFLINRFYFSTKTKSIFLFNIKVIYFGATQRNNWDVISKGLFLDQPLRCELRSSNDIETGEITLQTVDD